MAVFRVLGEQLVSESDFAAKGPELVRELANRSSGGSRGPTIMLGDDNAMGFVPAPAPAASGGVTTQFTAVKFGEPITIDIRHVWSGRVGAKDSVFGGTGDIAVVSGVKDWSAFKASARALNWLARDKGKKSALGAPGALNDGTPIIAYQKAVSTRQLTVTVELSSGPSDNNAVDRLAQLFSSAGRIPIMLPYAGALMAAGQILPAFSKLLLSISGGNPAWSQSEDLSFGVAGKTEADAGFRVIAAAAAPFQGMFFKDKVGLVDASGRAYDGDEPYVVIAVDGAPQPELEDFTATVVSAELMKRFQMSQDGSSAFDDLLDLTKIISDVKFRDEAVKVKGQLANASAAEKANLQARFDALVKNIGNAELKPA